jgi:hypothetical protein
MDQIVPFFADATPSERRVMRACVAANLCVIAFCAGYLALGMTASGMTWLHALAAAVVGYFMADLASGFVHWGMDTWFDERFFGRAVWIAREHHTHPQHILGYGFLEQATLGSAPSAVFIGAAALGTALFPLSPATCGLMVVWLLVATCLFFGTSFHNLCHRRPRSRLVRLAQKGRLLVPPADHWAHHRGDQTIRYCVINGWANHLCDRLRLWRGLERLVKKLTGAEPRRDDVEWQRRYREARGPGQMDQFPHFNSSLGRGSSPVGVAPPAQNQERHNRPRHGIEQ